MTMSSDNHESVAAETANWGQADTRPSLRIAFLVSVIVHTFFVFIMYRAYSELAGDESPPIKIVARSRVPLTVSAPVFASSPINAAALPEEVVRPAARPISFQPASVTARHSAVPPRMDPIPSTRRTTTIASLPITPVELPQPTAIAATDVSEFPSVMSPTTSLPRISSLPDPAIRIASRPTYGASEHRAVGMAVRKDVDAAKPVRRPTPAFANRGLQSRLSRESRGAIDLGLEFLARVQMDDGSWRFSDLRGVELLADARATQRADAAATGLVLLAFLGAGHDHYDGRYQHVVRDGLGFLTRIQQDRGNFFWDDSAPEGQITRFYSHGIATLALCEALGMTGDEELRTPAQHALNYLAGSQDPARNAWRYLPGVNSDAAATGWQLAALQAGQLAGLRVEPQTVASIRDCLAMCRVQAIDSERPRESAEQSVTTVNTAVGLAVDLHLGQTPQEEHLRGAAEHLLAHTPEVRDNAQPSPDADASESVNPRRDNYYWYYGSEAMHRLGGHNWQAWSEEFYPVLVESQIRTGPLAGSWDSRSNTLTYGNDCTGRLYVTAMNLLSLEIQQRQSTTIGTATPSAETQR